MDPRCFTPQLSPSSAVLRVPLNLSLKQSDLFIFRPYVDISLIPLFLSYSSLMFGPLVYRVHILCLYLLFMSPIHTNSRTIKDCRLRERNEARYFKDRCPER